MPEKVTIVIECKPEQKPVKKKKRKPLRKPLTSHTPKNELPKERR
jgi:hypothetical protein